MTVIYIILFACYVSVFLFLIMNINRLHKRILSFESKFFHDEEVVHVGVYNFDTTVNIDINGQFAYGRACCFDIQSAEDLVLNPGESKLVKTGFALRLPKGTECQIRPRSGMSKNMIQVQFGTVDEDYLGEIKVNLYNLGANPFTIKKGDRIAQGKIAPKYFAIDDGDRFVTLTKDQYEYELKNSKRGDSGYGSTGISKSLNKKV